MPQIEVAAGPRLREGGRLCRLHSAGGAFRLRGHRGTLPTAYIDRNPLTWNRIGKSCGLIVCSHSKFRQICFSKYCVPRVCRDGAGRWWHWFLERVQRVLFLNGVSLERAHAKKKRTAAVAAPFPVLFLSVLLVCRSTFTGFLHFSVFFFEKETLRVGWLFIFSSP